MPKQLLKLFVLPALLFFCTPVFAQNYDQLSDRIDSLRKLGLYKSALAEVDKLGQLARKNNNVVMQIKAAVFRMTYQSEIEENTQVAIIDTLQQDVRRAAFPVKPVLQSILAGMYYQYYQQNRWQFGRRTRLEKPGNDFTQWDLQTIIDETSRLYELSLQDAPALQKQSIAILDDVLTGDKSTRYLRPTLYDLLVQRALDFFLTDEAALTKPRQPFILNDKRLFADSRSFAALSVKTTDTNSTFYKGILYLQQATRFHEQKRDEEALADIDLKRLEFLSRHAMMDDKDSLYLKALSAIAVKYAAKPISADALVLQGMYYQQRDSLKKAFSYFKRAQASYPQSHGGKNAAYNIDMITQKQLSAVVENVNVPNKPLLAAVNYRNVKTARVIIYKVSATQYTQLENIPDVNRYNNGSMILASDSAFRYLKKLKPVTSELLQLPNPNDYHNHTTEFKINPLQSGHYVLVIKDEQSDERFLTQLTGFKISSLAFVTRHNADKRIEVEVMNRETGVPVAGVKVTIAETDHKVTDNNGRCYSEINTANQFSVKLTTATDTLYEGQRYNPGILAANDKAVDRTLFFTDRQIYRPGQTVYYKGLYLQTLNGKNELLPNKSLTVNIKDNNNKSITHMPVTTNEFGSFSGSFSIPQNILNGWVNISTDHGSVIVRVEEYKRPSFQVEFLPVKENYKPGDMVTLKGKVTAYSGYGLSRANVAYHITRTPIITDYRLDRLYNFRVATSSEIASDIIKTNDHGEFEIKFKATIDGGIDLHKINYIFTINADVTDGSGETRSANSILNIGVNDVQVITYIPNKIFAHDSIRISASVHNLNNVKQNGNLQLKVYALKQPGHLFLRRLWNKPDQYLLSAEEYKNKFPAYAYRNEDDEHYWKVLNQVANISKTANAQTPSVFNLDLLKKQPGGTYKIVITARNAHGDTASVTRYVNLINEPTKPQTMQDWVQPVKMQVSPGEAAEVLVGTGMPAHVLMETYNGTQLQSSQWLTIAGAKQQLIKIPLKADQNNLSVQFLMISQNRQYYSRQLAIKKVADDNLNIRFLTFRNKLQPGEKEQWKLQISGKDKEAAEMVADLYDASLDAITGQSNWNNSINNYYSYMPFYSNWNYDIAVNGNTNPLAYNNYRYNITDRQYEQLNILYRYNRGRMYSAVLRVADPGQKDAKGDPNADIRIDEPVGNSSLNEFVVASSNRIFTSAVQIRGTSTINGKEFSGEAMHYDEIRAMPGVKYAADTVAYKAEPYGLNAIATRKNFAETAFFYPQLHTDEKGEILIDFTVPEALTRWRFKAFAHTKDLKTGYIEQEIVTQKQLSINVNMPRFLREGDTITISARLANLTAGELKGKVNLQLLNAVNMQPLSLLINPADAEQSFTVNGVSTKAVSFRMVVPAGLEALTYRLTANAGKFTDGEENTLPVLTNRMLVTESMPMTVRAGKSRSFTFDKLVNQNSKTLQNKSLTLEYTQNPAWYAVQALPYMMEFPYECSEQTFSRYYANSLAANLVNHFPAVRRIFDEWKNSNSYELLSNLEKNQELKSTLIEETPWLRDAESETEQKKRIGLLFDLNKMSYELQQNLDKLKKMQLPNGGFPWFGGNYADRYITQHILVGMGQLYHSGVVDTKNAELKVIADKAMSYLDRELIDANHAGQQESQRILSPVEIHAYYTQSYFTSRTMSPAMKLLLADYLDHAAAQWKYRSTYEKAMIALTMQRDNKPEVAQTIMRSLMETAQNSDDMGMYWAKNQLGYYWYQSPVETQSLLIELFTETGNNDKAVEEMKIWLLRNKQTNDWKTTKATAAACYALLMKGNNWLSDGTSEISLGGKALTDLKPDTRADAGTGYIKTTWGDGQVKPELGKVTIKNNGKTISWGALHWQYLETLNKITPSKTDIQLERKYFIQKQTASGPVLTAVDAVHQPKTGDLLKVVVYLKAGRDYEYVQLKDMRPAGTEPVDVLSAYKYQDGLYYYQVTKDVATNFFISNLNKGNYVFEYSLRVAQPGSFSTGISSVQSMYAPEFNAHSEGGRLTVKSN